MLATERQILNLLAGGTALPDVLTELIRSIEARSQGMIGTICQLTPDGKRLTHCCAPGLPPEYSRALEGVEIGPKVGSCGTAAYTRAQVIVEDIEKSPLWAGWTEVARPYGLRSCWSTPILDKAGVVRGTFAFYYCSPRHPTEAELDLARQATALARLAIVHGQAQAQLHLLHAAIARLGDAVIITEAAPLDEPGPRIVFVNEAFERISGYRRDEVIGRSPRFLQGPGTNRHELARIKAALNAGQPVRAELLNYDRQGRSYWIEVELSPIAADGGDGPPTHFVSIQRDITERKRLQAQQLQAQRLQSIGTLAGGIAHDLNNILAPILMGLDMVRSQTPDPQLRSLLGTMENSAQRGADIVRQIVLFARGTPGRRTPVSIPGVLAELSQRLGESLRPNIAVEFDYPPALPPVSGEATHLGQVFLNLCTNARDAMPGGGTLRVSASATEVLEHNRPAHIDAHPGRYVRIDISDTGTGIPPEIQDRIFDPFFTTRGVGQGVGLGLSTAFSIVKSHDGFLTLESQLGRGSTFSVYLPVMAEAADRPEASVPGRDESILVVEAEDSTRSLMQVALTTYGYSVMSAGSQKEALAGLQHGAPSVALVDLGLPGNDGLLLVAQLHQRYPDLPIIVTGTAPLVSLASRAKTIGAYHFLAKPLTSQGLLGAVAGALAASQMLRQQAR